MKESDFLASLATNYGGVSIPIDCAIEFVGIDKKYVNYTKIDKSVNPPTLESCLVTYYIKNKGTEEEEVYISPSISNPRAIVDIKAAYDEADKIAAEEAAKVTP